MAANVDEPDEEYEENWETYENVDLMESLALQMDFGDSSEGTLADTTEGIMREAQERLDATKWERDPSVPAALAVDFSPGNKKKGKWKLLTAKRIIESAAIEEGAATPMKVRNASVEEKEDSTQRPSAAAAATLSPSENALRSPSKPPALFNRQQTRLFLDHILSNENNPPTLLRLLSQLAKYCRTNSLKYSATFALSNGIGDVLGLLHKFAVGEPAKTAEEAPAIVVAAASILTVLAPEVPQSFTDKEVASLVKLMLSPLAQPATIGHVGAVVNTLGVARHELVLNDLWCEAAITGLRERMADANEAEDVSFASKITLPMQLARVFHVLGTATPTLSNLSFDMTARIPACESILKLLHVGLGWLRFRRESQKPAAAAAAGESDGASDVVSGRMSNSSDVTAPTSEKAFVSDAITALEFIFDFQTTYSTLAQAENNLGEEIVLDLLHVLLKGSPEYSGMAGGTLVSLSMQEDMAPIVGKAVAENPDVVCTILKTRKPSDSAVECAQRIVVSTFAWVETIGAADLPFVSRVRELCAEAGAFIPRIEWQLLSKIVKLTQQVLPGEAGRLMRVIATVEGPVQMRTVLTTLHELVSIQGVSWAQLVAECKSEAEGKFDLLAALLSGCDLVSKSALDAQKGADAVVAVITSATTADVLTGSSGRSLMKLAEGAPTAEVAQQYLRAAASACQLDPSFVGASSAPSIISFLRDRSCSVGSLACCCTLIRHLSFSAITQPLLEAMCDSLPTFGADPNIATLLDCFYHLCRGSTNALTALRSKGIVARLFLHMSNFYLPPPQLARIALLIAAIATSNAEMTLVVHNPASNDLFAAAVTEEAASGYRQERERQIVVEYWAKVQRAAEEKSEVEVEAERAQLDEIREKIAAAKNELRSVQTKIERANEMLVAKEQLIEVGKKAAEHSTDPDAAAPDYSKAEVAAMKEELAMQKRALEAERAQYDNELREASETILKKQARVRELVEELGRNADAARKYAKLQVEHEHLVACYEDMRSLAEDPGRVGTGDPILDEESPTKAAAARQRPSSALPRRPDATSAEAQKLKFRLRTAQHRINELHARLKEVEEEKMRAVVTSVEERQKAQHAILTHRTDKQGMEWARLKMQRLEREKEALQAQLDEREAKCRRREAQAEATAAAATQEMEAAREAAAMEQQRLLLELEHAKAVIDQHLVDLRRKDLVIAQFNSKLQMLQRGATATTSSASNKGKQRQSGGGGSVSRPMSAASNRSSGLRPLSAGGKKESGINLLDLEVKERVNVTAAAADLFTLPGSHDRMAVYNATRDPHLRSYFKWKNNKRSDPVGHTSAVLRR